MCGFSRSGLVCKVGHIFAYSWSWKRHEACVSGWNLDQLFRINACVVANFILLYVNLSAAVMNEEVYEWGGERAGWKNRMGRGDEGRRCPKSVIASAARNSWWCSSGSGNVTAASADCARYGTRAIGRHLSFPLPPYEQRKRAKKRLTANQWQHYSRIISSYLFVQEIHLSVCTKSVVACGKCYYLQHNRITSNTFFTSNSTVILLK
jgi:hypothetical protein